MRGTSRNSTSSTRRPELRPRSGWRCSRRIRRVVAQRDDSLAREIGLLVSLGKYDEAIQRLTGREFSVWEGANLNVADNWVDAHVLRGRQELAAKRYKEALADFQAALQIPANLPSEGVDMRHSRPGSGLLDRQRLPGYGRCEAGEPILAKVGGLRSRVRRGRRGMRSRASRSGTFSRITRRCRCASSAQTEKAEAHSEGPRRHRQPGPATQHRGCGAIRQQRANWPGQTGRRRITRPGSDTWGSNETQKAKAELAEGAASPAPTTRRPFRARGAG